MATATDRATSNIWRATGPCADQPKNTMQPTIIISEPEPGTFQIDVTGKFGGGFRGLRTDREGVISRLGLLKSYDCATEPVAIICPACLEPEFRKIFPKSFAP